jgi:hypothetical protein
VLALLGNGEFRGARHRKVVAARPGYRFHFLWTERMKMGKVTRSKHACKRW